jgi:hypothetical protein
MSYTFPDDIPYVDVTAGSQDLQDLITVTTAGALYNPQSIFYSSVSEHLYMLQNKEGTGDLILNRYTSSGGGTFSSWNVPPTKMTLTNFGHGTSFGVWHNGGQDICFTECDADSNGRGSGITAFPWSTTPPNDSYTNHAPVHHILGDGADLSCSVDPNGNYIAIRQSLGIFGHAYTIYGVADFYTNGFNATVLLNGFPEDPSDSKEGSGGANAFQGFTVAGHYLYTLSQVAPPAPPPQGKGFFRSYDLNYPNPASGYYHAVGNNPASSVVPGEYEGLCVLPAGIFTTLGYMVSSGGHTPGSGIPYKFNLHART